MDNQPSQKRQQPKLRRQMPVSRESQFVGYVVLGLGVMAVIAVLLLAFTGDSVDTNEPLPDPNVSAELQSGFNAPDQPRVSQPSAEYAMPRQRDIDASDLTGGWQAAIGAYVGVLQINQGEFQIILARPEAEFPRLYSSGTYTMVNDIVVLKPQLNRKAPAAPRPDIKYERLTTGSYPMIVGFKNGAMIWQNVPESEKSVSAPPRSPLLLEDNRNYIVWKKVN